MFGEKEEVTKEHTSVSHAYLRANFLQKFALKLASSNKKKDESLDLLQRRINKELREISFTNKVFLNTDIKRSICKNKKCFNTLVEDNFEIKKKTNKKHQSFIERTCKKCDHVVRYKLKKNKK
uniref:Ribonuclease P protein component 4 n=1 Tax=Rhabditophanes sp. KR3021 TaxID=114890 RepID=A0AC35TJX2_9BILA